jgi:hypothetical protein
VNPEPDNDWLDLALKTRAAMTAPPHFAQRVVATVYSEDSEGAESGVISLNEVPWAGLMLFAAAVSASLDVSVPALSAVMVTFWIAGFGLAIFTDADNGSL